MNEDVELKVCKGCDAPLPYKPEAKSFFNKDRDLCDDCLLYKKEGKVKRLNF